MGCGCLYQETPSKWVQTTNMKFNKDGIDEFQTESFNCFALMINYYHCRCIPEVGKSHTIANMKDPYIHLSCWWICSDILNPYDMKGVLD